MHCLRFLQDELLEECDLRDLPTHGKMADLRARLKAADAKEAEEARLAAANAASAKGGAAGAKKSAAEASSAARTGGGPKGGAAATPGGYAAAGTPRASSGDGDAGIDIRSAYRNAPQTHKKRDASLLGKLKRNSGRLLCCVGTLGLVAGIAIAVVLAPAPAPAPAGKPAAAPSSTPSARPSPTTQTAYVDIDNVTVGGGPHITGRIFFAQHYSGGPTNFTVNLQGFPISAGVTLHGMHIHSNGDCGNPGTHLIGAFGSNHGSPTNTSAFRHAGDLGNLAVSAFGTASIAGSDPIISLRGTLDPYVYIVGKALVIHVGVDDFGLGANTGANCGPTNNANCTSLKTGNAGPQLACGIIMAGGSLRRR